MRVLKGAVFLLFVMLFAWVSASDDLFGSALQLMGGDNDIINLPDVSNDTSGCYLLFM